tara:strand:+ start:500 stop:733 length:234 start_codon:yes stop_codon:yes gene_type:complete
MPISPNKDSDSTLHKLTLSDAFRDSLAGQPESGMGFQNVICEMADGQRIKGLVINGNELETVAQITAEEIRSIQVEG